MEVASRGRKWWGRTALGTALRCWVANNGHCIEKARRDKERLKEVVRPVPGYLNKGLMPTGLKMLAILPFAEMRAKMARYLLNVK